jgi:hypothetical protein
MFEEGVISGQKLNVAEYITRGLAYHLFTPILSDRDALDASRRVLALVDQIPAEPAFFAEFGPKLARLALAVIREKGWQPSSLGGDDSVADEILGARQDGLVLYSVRCPGVSTEDTWRNFFLSGPTFAPAARPGTLPGREAVMTGDNIPIWSDPDVPRIYDLRDGQPWPRFAVFNDNPEQLKLVVDFVQADQAAGSNGPANLYVDACLAGVRLVEALTNPVDPGWIKFFVHQIDQNNSFLWDLHRRAPEVAAIGEWTVTTIERRGWGPNGRTSALGQAHSNAMALAAEAGGGLHLNQQTGLMEYGDGSEARRMAGVVVQPQATSAEPSMPEATPTTGSVDDDGPSLGGFDVLGRHLEAAEDGDKASRLIIEAAAADTLGDQSRALELYEQAARLGEVQAMYDAGLLHEVRGDLQSASFWFEAAAEAGTPRGSPGSPNSRIGRETPRLSVSGREKGPRQVMAGRWVTTPTSCSWTPSRLISVALPSPRSLPS